MNTPRLYSIVPIAPSKTTTRSGSRKRSRREVWVMNLGVARWLRGRRRGRPFEHRADDRRGELAGDAIVQRPELADRHCLNLLQRERRLAHQPLEAPDRHLVEPPLDFAEAG